MERFWLRRWTDGRRDALLAGLAFLISLSLYMATLSPGLSSASPDGNELITICATLGLAHPTGYPLYTWIGKAFTLLPIGTVAYRVNLMSAVSAAGGVALLYGIIRLLAQERLPAFLVALFFAFSRTFWSQATIAEVYAPNLFMVALTLFFFLLWAEREGTGSGRGHLYLLLGALFLGLSLGTHLSNVGFIPAYALFALLVNPRLFRRPLPLLGAVGLFALACLQYLWLPYKGTNLTDAMMPRNNPTTWQGFYNYTLGAFPQMKFAFSLPQIPERIVLYLDLLGQNVGLGGMLAGLYGLAEMLWRRTAHFYLVLGMYLVHVWFFIQYRVFDLDVFFIPAHLLYTIAIGYGVACGLGYLRRWVVKSAQRWPRAVAGALAAGLLLVPVIVQAAGNYAWADRSGDTATEDFYRNVFRLLPEGSVLLGQSGVFGFDMFYFRLVEGARPDVIIPMLGGPGGRSRDLSGREVFSTLVPAQRARPAGPGGAPPGLYAPESWPIPVLVGESDAGGGTFPSSERVLYRISAIPPELIVPPAAARPRVVVGADLGGVIVVGYTVGEEQVPAGGMLHLTLYLRPAGRVRGLIATGLGKEMLESHPLGFGNLERYIQEVRPLGDGVVMEDYALVVPSDMPAGEYPLRIGVVLPQQGEERWVEVGKVGVVRAEGREQRAER